MSVWETSFIAMRVALGATAQDAAQSLSTDRQAHVAELMAALGDRSRGTRARALASAIALIVIDVEKSRLV